MRYPDPDRLRDQARALRREALSGIACEGKIKWKALMDLLRKRRPPLATAHAPFTCQGPSPTHP